jgi:hypothetical protein
VPYDIFKVGSSHYQVFETATNSPVGPLHLSRKAAEAYEMEIWAEMYMAETYGMTTVERTVAGARVSPKQPHDTVGRSAKTDNVIGGGKVIREK